MMPIQIPLANLPVHLVCLMEDASVAFVKVAHVGVIFEADKKGSTLFTEDGFFLNGVAYEYNVRYHYKEIPDMLSFLQAQNLIMPTFI